MIGKRRLAEATVSNKHGDAIVRDEPFYKRLAAMVLSAQQVYFCRRQQVVRIEGMVCFLLGVKPNSLLDLWIILIKNDYP